MEALGVLDVWELRDSYCLIRPIPKQLREKLHHEVFSQVCASQGARETEEWRIAMAGLLKAYEHATR